MTTHSAKFYSNQKQVQLEMYVRFMRKGNFYIGKIIEKRENTVMVEMERQDASQLGLENNLTVVNYKRITIVPNDNELQNTAN